MNLDIKYWEKSGDILVSTEEYDCFILNSKLNRMVNWLNLHQSDILKGNPIESDSSDGLQCLSVKGNLMLRTERDIVFINKELVPIFMKWLNDHRKILSIHEVWP